MDKVLVKKAVSAQYPVGAGAPIMVLGSGGRGGRARTIRESAGGLAGGALGALGALTGQHRSLGSLVQSGISGAAQGGAIGRGLGRVLVGPESQARANLRREMADKYSAARASGEFDRYGVSSRRTPRTRVGVSMRANEMGSSLYDLEQAKQAEKDMLAQQRAEAMARARAQGTQFGTQQRKDAEAMAAFRRETGLDPNMAASQFMGPMGAAIRERQQQGSQPSSVGQLPPPSKGRGVNVVGGKVMVNGQEVELDAQGNYSAPGIDITGSVMGGGPEARDAMLAAMGDHFASGGKPGGAAVAVKEAMLRNMGRQGGQPGGVDAAGRPVQVINPNTSMSALPAPSNLSDTAAGENKRMDDMGNQALVAQGTDNARAKTVEVTPPQQQEGDEEMSDQQREAIERQMMMQGRVGVQSSQPQDNRRQSRLSEF